MDDMTNRERAVVCAISLVMLAVTFVILLGLRELAFMAGR
jgi:ABC-type sulfate transport system permease component